MQRAIAASALLLLLIIAGCGEPVGRVHGLVTYQGKPLTEGTVAFLDANNQTYLAEVKNDGTYEAKIPRGKCRVVVQVQEVRPPSRPNPRADAGKDMTAKVMASNEDMAKSGRLPTPPAVPSPAKGSTLIPAQYNDPNKSGLSLDVSGADQNYPIELK
jgi:hypothetical protein